MILIKVRCDNKNCKYEREFDLTKILSISKEDIENFMLCEFGLKKTTVMTDTHSAKYTLCRDCRDKIFFIERLHLANKNKELDNFFFTNEG